MGNRDSDNAICQKALGLVFIGGLGGLPDAFAADGIGSPRLERTILLASVKSHTKVCHGSCQSNHRECL